MRLTSIADLQQPGIALMEQQAMQLSRLFDDLLENYPDDSHMRAGGIHASELCACKRQVVYDLLNVEKRGSAPAIMRKRFNVGHAIHNMIQNDMHLLSLHSQGRLLFQEEVSVNDTELAKRLCIASSCDGVFTFLDEEGQPALRIGLEIKTASPDDYDSLKKAKEKHIEQAHVYMACLDLPLMWFMYWNKGNQNYTPSVPPFLIRFDAKLWKKLEARAVECLTAAEQEKLPDKEEGQHCRWCKYAWTCNPSTATPTQKRRIVPILGRR